MTTVTVFLSYSSTPPENVEFVRDLANRLRKAGFDVWLDEERLPGGIDITQRIGAAIDCCDAALLVVNEDWLEKKWTRYEGEQFAERGVKVLKVLRQPVERRRFGPPLWDLTHVDWFAGDADPDARFWQIYCGLKDCSPGARSGWSQSGRRLLHGDLTPDTAPPKRSPNSATARPAADAPPSPINTTAQPILSRWSGDALYLLMDDQQWYSVDNRATISALPRCSFIVSDTAVDHGELVVSSYHPTLARLTSGAWEYHSVDSPVLRLLSTTKGLFAGTADGRVMRLDGSSSATIARLDEPILDLHEFDGGLVVLGGDGTLARLLWPSDGQPAAATRLNTEPLGRPVQLFSAGSDTRIGVFSHQAVGVYHATDNWSLHTSELLDDAVAQVLAFGQENLLVVVTDGGELWTVDPSSQQMRAVQLPGRSQTVLGAARAAAGKVYAWTGRGELFLVQQGGGVRSVPGGNVISVHARGEADGRAMAIERSQSGNLSARVIES